jgi:sialic acid synthase SpsE
MSRHITLKTPKGNIQIGEGLPTHLIAEIGLNHNGSFQLAKEMIYQAALSGASFVKLQKRDPVSLASSEFLDAPFMKCPTLGKSQREVRKRLELSFAEYQQLIKYSTELGLIFFASAFDLISLDFLMKLNVPVMKIASHSITNGPLLRKVAEYKIPVICSFGGTTEQDRDKAVEILSGNPLVILHCVSSYPTPDHLAMLDTISYLKEKYDHPVGFSSHERGIDISIAAAVLGACMIERHFTIDPAMIGLDQGISITPNEFSELAMRVKRLSGCRGVTKGLMEEEKGAKYNYHVGVHTTRNIKKGEVICDSDIICKQPLISPKKFFTGLDIEKVIGKTVLDDISKDNLIPRIKLDG